MEAYLAPWGRPMTGRESEYDSKPSHLLLLARNETGYKNLLQIASAAQLKGFYFRPRIDHDFLAKHSEGLIATSGCLAAEIPRLVERGQENEAKKRMGWYQEVFGRENFFLELQHHNIDQLHILNRWLIEEQGYANIPLVATNDVHYVLEEDYDTHDTLLCIQTGSMKAEQNRLRFESPTFHLRTPEEMWRLFANIPEALTNTLLIADMCDVNLDSEGYHLPVFPVPAGHSPRTYLRHLCERGLAWRFGDRADDPDIRARLDYELHVIHDMGFDTYFLIVWDLCEFARHADIWWNVRGSGAGSLAAYCLGITNIDPMHNSLLFERFLNPGRKTMPDIDLDYPEDRRAEMIEYCAKKYGEDKVAAIITFGTLGSKAAIRDVGRAFDLPLPEVDRIARLIPSAGKPIKFDDALGDDPDKALPDLKAAYASDPTAHKLIDAAREMEGITRHASTHAAGVIVADRPLVEYIPLHRPTKGSPEDAPVKMVTQFPMETCESIGLLKVDFLGLSTLTIMRKACEMIERYHGIHYDLSNIPYRADPDDPDQAQAIAEMFEMIGRGETIGVFQLESQGMRRMLTDMRPKRFENIVAAVALYRPGPMEYIPSYNRRLHGEEPIEFKHPLLEPILEETYGIIVYQEQIMQIGAELFGYSLGEADLMRRAVSKKKEKDLRKHRETFVERGPEHGVDGATANHIFDDIEFFARYGFNKSHAADYAVLTCQTAFLKCHYPHEYMAALMSVHRDNSAKVGLFAADCSRMGIAVLPPTVNGSLLDFSIETQPDGQRAIRFGLAAIKNVGVVPLEHVIAQREHDGPFRDLDDFCRRVDTRVVNKRALESLIKVGALDEFATRPTLLAAQDRIISFSAEEHKAKDSGQMSLFGENTGVSFGADESILAHLHDVESISKREMLNWEKELVGLYVTDHPLKAIVSLLDRVTTSTNAELIEAGDAANGHMATVAGLVTNLRTFFTKKGDSMAVLAVEDVTATISAVLFPRTWENFRDMIDMDAVVILRGKVDTSRGDVQIIVEEVRLEQDISVPDEPLADLQERTFSWLEPEDDAPSGEDSADDLAEQDDLYDDTGDSTPGTLTDDVPPMTEAMIPASAGASVATAPPIVPAALPPDEPPHSAGPLTDREMPGWLEAEEGDWTEPTAYVYHNGTGHIIGVEEPEPEDEPDETLAKPAPAFDAAGRVMPPPAPADRPRAVESAHARPPEAESPVPMRRLRPAAPPPPAPAEDEPGRLLTLYIPRSNDTAHDRALIRRLHGLLTQYPGPDHFRFVIETGDKRACLDFPNHNIHINDDVLNSVATMIGEENITIDA